MGKFTDRTGETNTATNGQRITIIAYRSSNDIDVQFEDGYVAYHRKYELFKKGQIVNPAKPNLNNPVRRGIVDKTGKERIVYDGETARITGYRNSNDIDIEFSCGLKIEHTCYLNFRNSDFRIQISAYKRVGEENTANNGQRMTIAAYRSADDIDVRFEDGTLVSKKSYKAFQDGKIKNPNGPSGHVLHADERLGETAVALNGQIMTIIRYQRSGDIDVRFEDGTVVSHISYWAFRQGCISNPNFRNIRGCSYNELVCRYYFSRFGFKKAPKHSIDWLGGKELDLYNSDCNGKKVAIEYDGFNHTVKKDKEKDRLCRDNDVILYRIREPHLECPDASYAKIFRTDTSERYSDSLIDAIKAVINDINCICGTSFEIFVDRETDKKCIDAMLHLRYDRYRAKRIGEVREMNNGMLAEIIRYDCAGDIDVKFEDGYIAHTDYGCFKKGIVGNPNQNTQAAKFRIREGETVISDRYGKIELIKYVNSHECTVRFKDGTIAEHVNYCDFRDANVRKPGVTFSEIMTRNERRGETGISSQGQKMIIAAYRGADDIDVRFEDGTLVQHRSYCAFRTGQIANPNVKRRAHKRNRNLKDRTGEVSYTHDRHDRMTLTAYRGANDVDITFDDGTTVCHRRYRDFKTGAVSKPRTGESNINNQGLKMTIIAYRTVYDIDVRFEDGYVSEHKLYACFKNGQIADPNVKLKYHYHKGYTGANAKSVTAPDGKTYHSIAEAARAYGLSPDVVRGRQEMDSFRCTPDSFGAETFRKYHRA